MTLDGISMGLWHVSDSPSSQCSLEKHKEQELN